VIGQAFSPEAAPVIRNDLIQRVHNVIERVCF
jgi:hypothetical protein